MTNNYHKQNKHSAAGGGGCLSQTAPKKGEFFRLTVTIYLPKTTTWVYDSKFITGEYSSNYC